MLSSGIPWNIPSITFSEDTGNNTHIETIASIWCENMLDYLSVDIICSEKRTVFQESKL